MNSNLNNFTPYELRRENDERPTTELSLSSILMIQAKKPEYI